MRNVILLLVIISFFACSNEQKVKSYYPNKALESEYTLVDGLKDGRYVLHYENGKIQLETFYREGLQHGYVNRYYENGTLAITGHVLYNLLDGWFYMYNKESRLDSAILFIQLDTTGYDIDYFLTDTITKETASRFIDYSNMIIKYKEDNVVDVETSLLCNVFGDSIMRNDSMVIKCSFTNPYQYYNYNPDSIEVFMFYNNNNYKYQVYSTKYPIEITYITFLHDLNVGLNYFNMLITLHLNNNKKRNIYVKRPFEIRKM